MSPCTQYSDSELLLKFSDKTDSSLVWVKGWGEFQRGTPSSCDLQQSEGSAQWVGLSLLGLWGGDRSHSYI